MPTSGPGIVPLLGTFCRASLMQVASQDIRQVTDVEAQQGHDQRSCRGRRAAVADLSPQTGAQRPAVYATEATLSSRCSKIRHLTDVFHCNLQQHFSGKRR
jgi:hypothetical protein